ncbi:MAG: anaerobic glycerol-3-phosphate dehydrogenase subunit B, partial [Desulfobacteraceae bacterium]|nr:anaerobic glycerol-3-phosphate dehydrogenase subunit B [Desulfobacteraceae bacterium]
RRTHWHALNFFEPTGHPINTAGVKTNKMFRPLDEKGNMVFENLFVVGSILAHNDWARLKTGAGVCFASAVKAVQHCWKAFGEQAK